MWRTEFQDHPAQQIFPLPFPSVTHSSVARMRHSREPQGWSVYNYPISIQQVTRHFINLIIKKLIHVISGAERNSPRWGLPREVLHGNFETKPWWFSLNQTFFPLLRRNREGLGTTFGTSSGWESSEWERLGGPCHGFFKKDHPQRRSPHSHLPCLSWQEGQTVNLGLISFSSSVVTIKKRN